MNKTTQTLRLHDTFRAYVEAEGVAMRAYINYQFGKATEAEVHRLQRLEATARDAHIEAMNEATA